MLFVNQDVLVMPYKDPEMGRLRGIARYIYIRDNPESLERQREYSRHWRQARYITDEEFREKEIAKSAEYRETHREYFKDYEREYRQNNRIDLITLLGCKCAQCGYDNDIRGLQIDHINGGGTREVEETFHSDTHSMYRYYLKHPEEAKKKLQMLCANCNQIKEYKKNGGELA